MKQQQFTIESYEVVKGVIIVMLEKYDIGIPVTIPQDKFEWWLRVEDKLQWVFDTSDHTGEHQQFNGTMSMDEYWATSDIDIHNDLYGYITGNPITYEGAVFTNSMDSILLAFDLHNAKRVNSAPFERWEHGGIMGATFKLKNEAMNHYQTKAFVKGIKAINAAITGHVLSGATIKEIAKVTGVSLLDIEAVIINKKLNVNPN